MFKKGMVGSYRMQKVPSDSAKDPFKKNVKKSMSAVSSLHR